MKKLFLWEKIFIKINILIILLIIFFYGYRTLFYYRKLNTINDNITIKEKVIKDLTYQNDGLYEDNNTYYYKGIEVNNFVLFQGRLFRIISIDQGIKMIEEDNNTNLIWSINTDYKDSIINKWLNNYLNTFKNYSDYLLESSWCNNNIDINNYSCDNTINSYIGLINVNEYLKAGGKNSYLNNDTYYWTLNYSDNKAYFINNEGSINNIVNSEDNYYSYGIRPVIVLKEDLRLVDGDGSSDNPYIVINNEHELLKDSYIGEYVEYNSNLYRIINTDSGTTLLSEESLDETKYSDISKELAKYLKEFKIEDLVKVDYCISTYNFSNNYEYNCSNDKSDYITIPKVGDLFLNNNSSYWLNTIQNKNLNLYYTMDNDLYFGDLTSNKYGLRIMIKLKEDIKINDGDGSIDNPYQIGENYAFKD